MINIYNNETRNEILNMMMEAQANAFRNPGFKYSVVIDMDGNLQIREFYGDNTWINGDWTIHSYYFPCYNIVEDYYYENDTFEEVLANVNRYINPVEKTDLMKWLSGNEDACVSDLISFINKLDVWYVILEEAIDSIVSDPVSEESRECILDMFIEVNEEFDNMKHRN